MIDLQKLHDKFDQQKVVFVGINTLDDQRPRDNRAVGIFLFKFDKRNIDN